MEAAAIIVVVLLIYAIPGTIAAVIARRKGRNAFGWFFGGVFLGIIGIVIVAVLPNPKAEASYRDRAEAENRRLREQLRQERVKGESFRQFSAQRLDAHDSALGMDTRTLAAGDAAPAMLDVPDAPAPPPVDPDATPWYYEKGGEAKGPVPASVISALLATGQISLETLVWCEGMPGWEPVRAVPVLTQAHAT